MTKEIKKLVPLSIYEKGVDLEPYLGVKEVAWDIDNALKVIDILTRQKNIFWIIIKRMEEVIYIQ